MTYLYKGLDYFYDLSETYNSDEHRIKRVYDLYTRYSDHRFPLGAGLVKGNAFVSGGCNERRRHASLYPYREALHAEQVAIMSARCNIEGSTLYVCRENQDPGPQPYSLARPCFWCMHQIIKAGIDRVVYSADSGVEAFKVSTVRIQPIESIKGLPLELKVACA